MEQKKLLLVAISVGVFFVIVIGAAIIAFGPKTQGAVAAAAPIRAGAQGVYQAPVDPIQPASVDPSGLVREGVQGLQTPPEGTGSQGTDYYINGGAPQVVITVDPKSAAGVPDAAPSGRAATPVRTAAPKPAAAAPKPAAPKAVVSGSTPAVQTRAYNDYWVQAGSFTAKGRAEGVKEVLAGKGISSVIMNSDQNGATYFRVRVGPYTSQNEADYWLSLIKSIDGFEASQIWQSQSKH